MTLHKAVKQYIALKQSLGFRFHGQSVILAAFSKAMGKVSLCQIKPRAVQAYLDGRGPVTRYWHYKWETLHPFYRYAMARGWARRSPLPVQVPKLDITFTTIFTRRRSCAPFSKPLPPSEQAIYHRKLCVP